MADTLTPNYKWVQPAVGGDPATWGAILNTDLGLIDAQVYANQQAGVPIGSVIMFAGSAAPTNWLICDGSQQVQANYQSLFNVIGNTYGGSAPYFNLPNLQLKFPFGAGTGYALGKTGGEATHALTLGETGAHYHNVSDPEHYHTINQGSHTHGDYGHVHGVSASQDAHDHTVNNQNTTPFAGTTGVTTAGVSSGSTSTAQPAVHVSINTGYANLAPSGTGVTNTDWGSTRITTTDTQGSGAPHNNMPPYVAVNFIIRYQ